ncbi:hypothetical protein D7Z26_06380 [Cohnella endophytica]|uniref:Integrase catalytic domain-containing protein n=1 Tax=Cohnella endophytica TaxID=2419778 RepID=A0A494Y0G6_9BACL|nr:hypothetical protein [Cohnella endophytica]RKP56259.1 hypothetical protein D7Z26_06380 [Cohnella endophytica]
MKKSYNGQVAELDTIKLDLFIEDEKEHFRPTIILAVDQFTRKVVGQCISLSTPDQARIKELLQNITSKGDV